jgi:hypothetical protein
VTAPTISDLISRQGAAQKLGIHVNSFDRLARELGLTRYRVLGDSRVHFLRADIDAIDVVQPVEGS